MHEFLPLILMPSSFPLFRHSARNAIDHEIAKVTQQNWYALAFSICQTKTKNEELGARKSAYM